mgnify:CR=1 FL=1
MEYLSNHLKEKAHPDQPLSQLTIEIDETHMFLMNDELGEQLCPPMLLTMLGSLCCKAEVVMLRVRQALHQ